MKKNTIITILATSALAIIANLNLNLGIGLIIVTISVLTLLFIRRLWHYYVSIPDQDEVSASRRRFIKSTGESIFRRKLLEVDYYFIFYQNLNQSLKVKPKVKPKPKIKPKLRMNRDIYK